MIGWDICYGKKNKMIKRQINIPTGLQAETIEVILFMWWEKTLLSIKINQKEWR